MYIVAVKSLGNWYAFRMVQGRAAARREALRLGYDCGFTSDNVRVLPV